MDRVRHQAADPVLMHPAAKGDPEAIAGRHSSTGSLLKIRGIRRLLRKPQRGFRYTAGAGLDVKPRGVEGGQEQQGEGRRDN